VPVVLREAIANSVDSADLVGGLNRLIVSFGDSRPTAVDPGFAAKFIEMESELAELRGQVSSLLDVRVELAELRAQVAAAARLDEQFEAELRELEGAEDHPTGDADADEYDYSEVYRELGM
jgi:hypothetical protein